MFARSFDIVPSPSTSLRLTRHIPLGPEEDLPFAFFVLGALPCAGCAGVPVTLLSALAYPQNWCSAAAAPATRPGVTQNDTTRSTLRREFYRARRSGQQRGYLLYLSLAFSLIFLAPYTSDEQLIELPFYVMSQFFYPLARERDC